LRGAPAAQAERKVARIIIEVQCLRVKTRPILKLEIKPLDACPAFTSSIARRTGRRLATLEQEVRAVVREINASYGAENYQPILLVMRHCQPGEVFELFRAADFCIVSSLHDRVNLVAKEFVAARDDELGVLVLPELPKHPGSWQKL
jgi:hypothetical protein